VVADSRLKLRTIEGIDVGASTHKLKKSEKSLSL
jgi:hypothetical protein